MRLNGRRESSNVDDRRRMGGGSKAGLGIGGIIVAALLTWAMGGNPLSVLQYTDIGNILSEQPYPSGHEPTAGEEALAKFSRQILAGTEDVWTKEFQKMGLTYQPPRLVLFTGSVQSACGGATSSSGPFYCSADQSIYIDLSFFSQMQQQLGADGDFAYAYVIAHEVGHHVQYLLGILDHAHQQMSMVNEKESNRISVRLELQADFLAGIWARYDNEMFSSLEEGDIEEGLNVASRIGDDYLQKKAQGYTVPDAFNHGTSAQRVKWLKKGLNSKDLSNGDTFSLPYNEL